MNRELVRKNQKLVDSAYSLASNVGCDMVRGLSHWLNADDGAETLERLELHGLDIDSAVTSASKCLSALMQLQYIRDAAKDAGVVSQAASMLPTVHSFIHSKST